MSFILKVIAVQKQKQESSNRQITILGRQSKTNLSQSGDNTNKTSQQPQQLKDDNTVNSQLAATTSNHYNQYSSSSLSYTCTGTTGPSQVTTDGANYVSEFEGMVQGTKNLSVKDGTEDNVRFFSFWISKININQNK